MPDTQVEEPGGVPSFRSVHPAPDENNAAPEQNAENGSERSHGRAKQAQRVHRRYFRLLRLSRFALAGFVLLAAIFFLWAIPWLPSGLDTADYTAQFAFTVYLIGGIALAGVFALALQEMARRDRESLMVWTSVYDETTGMHTRQYLYDRLSLECERARRGGRPCTLLVFQPQAGAATGEEAPIDASEVLHQIARMIDALTHSADMVARLSSSELALLAMGVGREDRDALLARLRSAVEQELPRVMPGAGRLALKGGCATFDVDGTDEHALVQAARTAAMFGISAHRAKAA